VSAGAEEKRPVETERAADHASNGAVIGYRHDDLEVDPPYLYPDYVSTRTRAPKRP
jgi:hypothetical protein